MEVMRMGECFDQSPSQKGKLGGSDSIR